jgi:hypothetical protein
MTKDIDILDLLTEQLANHCHSLSKKIRISRRAFITGLGASGLLAMPVSVEAAVPRWRFVGRRLLLRYGRHQWAIDPAAYGAQARLRAHQLRGLIVIRLAQATLPGTALCVDYTLTLQKVGRLWMSRLELPALGFSGEAPLGAVMEGGTWADAIRRSSWSAGTGDVRTSQGRLEVGDLPRLTIMFAGGAAMDNQAQAQGSSLQLVVVGREGSVADRAGVGGGSYVTAFRLSDPVLRMRAYACADSKGSIALRPSVADGLAGAFVDRPGGACQVLLIDAPANLEVRRGPHAATPLRFGRAVSIIGPQLVGVVGEIVETPFLVAGNGYAAAVRGGDDGKLFRAVFRAGAAHHFSADLAMDRLLLPIADGDQAVIATGGQAVQLHHDGNGSSIDPAGATAVRIAGADVRAMRLDDKTVNLRRGADLFNMTFRFDGFELHKSLGNRTYVRRIVEHGRCLPATITILLPSQHIGEHIENYNGGGACPSPNEKLGDYARFAAPSRIVFKLDDEPRRGAVWREKPLTIEALTNWSELWQHLSLPGRARVGDALEDQLKAAGLDAAQTLELRQVLTIIQGTLQPPKLDETAFELAAKLIFAPGKNVRWEMPGQAPDSGFPLFGIRLGHRSDIRLRAIWSDYFTPGRFPSLAAPGAGDPQEGVTLSQVDHWGIIGQTSVYGLPALRRITTATPAKDPLDASLAKVPRGGVVVPKSDYQYLADAEQQSGVAKGEIGVALATTFDDADITLTALGATMRLDWRGEPAVLKPDSSRNFSLERLTYSTWLGRDERVIAADKGFLFPFGFRATLLTINQRVYVPDPAGTGTVAIEIRRRRIVTRRPTKNFPAIGQPDSSRDWAASSMTLLTDTTPDLIKWSDPDGGGITLSGAYGPLKIFWPRVRVGVADSADFEWKTQVETDSTPLLNRMIFVESRAAQVPDVIEQIVAAYNGPAFDAVKNDTAWPLKNIARLSGTRRRYADSLKQGDTSFDTDSWLVTARGRDLSGTAAFVMDARMNGADQPAFYPSILRTKVNVQSIDRLLGPQGLIECRPDPDFVKKGFTGDKTDSQIFIDVMKPRLAFNVTGAGHVSGGLAQPNSLIAAISRVSGLVGGTAPDAKADPGMPPAFAARLVKAFDPGADLDFSSAKQNRFEPKEFFGKSLSILGINLINLVEAVADDLGGAPKLVETVESGLGQGLDAVRKLINDAADVVDALFAKGEQCAQGQCKSIDGAISLIDVELNKHGLSVATLYPDFYKAYVAARDADLGAKLRAFANAQGLGDATDKASAAVVIVKPLLAAIEALLENPVPQQFEGAIQTVDTVWTGVKTALQGGIGGIADYLVDYLLKNVLGPALVDLATDEIALLLGSDKITSDQALELLSDPSARGVLAQDLLYQYLADPLLRIGDTIRDLTGAARGRLSIARFALRSAIADLVAQGAVTVAPLLDPNQPSILDPEKQTALKNQLLGVVDAALQTLQPQPGNNLQAQLASLPNRFEVAIAGQLQTTVRANASLFPVKTGEIATAALDHFMPSIETARQRAVAAVIVARDATLALAQKYDGEPHKFIQSLATTLVDMLRAALDVGTFVAVNRAATAVSSWCTDHAGGALAAVAAFGDGVLADGQDIASYLIKLIDDVAALNIPPLPPETQATFDAARKTLLAEAAALTPLIKTLEQRRQVLNGTLASANACFEGPRLLRRMEGAIDARNDALSCLARLLAALRQMEIAAKTLPGAVVKDAVTLLQQLSPLYQLARTDLPPADRPLTKIVAAANSVEAALAAYPDHVTTMQNAAKALIDDIAKYAQISGDPAGLAQAAAYLVANYTAIERQLCGAVLSTIAISDASLSKLQQLELQIIAAIAGTLAGFEQKMAAPLAALLAEVDTNALLSYLLDLVGIARFRTAVGDLQKEATNLDTISHLSDPQTAATFAGALVIGWSKGDIPLLRVFDALVYVADALFQGNVEKLFANDVRALVAQLRDQLTAVISQLVPTRITTSFSWETMLGENAIFKMLRKPGAASDKKDLSLSSTTMFDFATRQTTASVSGELQPFSIALPNMVTIDFDKVVFTGGTGQSMSFKVRVTGVVLGPYLSFLSALQEWMNPSGNGIYVRPSFDSIQVGYIFASDLITVGDLEFINIAMEVYAKLPFGSEAAKFGFNFASEDRPFLIACAPYGGGGYFLMETDAGGSINALSLSFVFGAVVAFEFSILKGSGRITAGMALTKRGDGLTLQAIIEALGEGHIACFSLSIFIRITLTHYSTGDMYGQATYSFKFKVAFVSLHYSVTATRHISGNGEHPAPQGGGDNRMMLAAQKAGGPPAGVATFKIASAAPVKSRQWGQYRRHLALDLIDEEW